MWHACKKIITFKELKTYFKRLIETEFRLKHRDYVKAMELAEKLWRKTKKREQKDGCPNKRCADRAYTDRPQQKPNARLPCMHARI